MSYKRVRGAGGFNLDDYNGILSDDGTTLSGKNVDPDHKESDGEPWTVSSTKTLSDVDPPLDVDAAKAVLGRGPWLGRVSSRPAKLTFAASKDGKVASHMTQGGAAATLGVEVKNDGSVTMTAQPKPTSAGLVTDVYHGVFMRRTLKVLGGVREISTTQGFVTQNGEPWSVAQEEPRAKK